MDFGLMMGIAYPLYREEREAIANFPLIPNTRQAFFISRSNLL